MWYLIWVYTVCHSSSMVLFVLRFYGPVNPMESCPACIATDKALFFIQKMLISFLFLNKNICCGYTLEAPRRGASNEYPQHMFSSRNKKNIMWIPTLIYSYKRGQFLTNHTFTGRISTSIVHFLLPETDNCHSCIRGRERMTVETASIVLDTSTCNKRDFCQILG